MLGWVIFLAETTGAGEAKGRLRADPGQAIAGPPVPQDLINADVLRHPRSGPAARSGLARSQGARGIEPPHLIVGLPALMA